MPTVKPITINSYFSFINHTINTLSNVRDYVYGRSMRDVKLMLKEPGMKFEVIEHAFPRWNTRVGPFIDDVHKLEQAIAFLHSCRRVKLYFKQLIGTIDDDILFTFEKKNKKTITITTFYGRVNLVPSLEDFSALRKYNRKSGDSIPLEQPEEVLAAQSFVIQKEMMYFEGIQQKYLMEKFETHSGEIIYFTVLEGSESGNIVEVNPYIVNPKIAINGRCLGALKDMGYGFFVEQYLESIRSYKQVANSFVTRGA